MTFIILIGFNNNNNNNLNIFMQDCCFSFKKKTAINAGPGFGGEGGSFLDKGTIYGGHFNKTHESSIFSKQ